MNKVTAYVSFVSLLALGVPLAGKPNPPNVILMMADDLGYNDLSCYGSKKQKTPVLDQLVKEGIRLTGFYAGATVCTPSRMALLTGAYPPRLGWRGGVGGYGIKPLNGLAPEALTMGEVFKEAGYQTSLIGKWHLGDSPQLQPMKQGFDTAFYINKSNNQTKKLWQGEKLVADPFDNRRLSETFAAQAIEFIEANPAKPVELGRHQVPELKYPCWAAPILSDKRLYVRSEDYLICFDIAK